MPGIVGPERFPIRDPKTGEQVNGRNVNPVGYPDMGGLTSASKWTETARERMRLEKPTSVRAAKSTKGTNADA